MSKKNKNRNEAPVNSTAQSVLTLIGAVLLSISVPILVSRGVLNFGESENSVREISEKTAESEIVSDDGSEPKTEESSSKDVSEKESEIEISEEVSKVTEYMMSDIAKLGNTDYFAKGTLEHIFDGTINKKGNATGYHYTMVADSKGKIIEGTKSEPDKNGVFTGKVEVDGVKKNGFSSFYPEDWTPQEVVDAINAAYEDALSNPDNPSDSLWRGYYNGIEIDMYLNDKNQITTAYPIFEK